MSTVKYIVGNYLKVLGVDQATISEMLDFLSDHPSYPSLRSIVECFEEWQFECTAAEATVDQLKLMGNCFIAFLKSPRESFVFVVTVQEDQIIYLSDIGEIISEKYDVFNSKWSNIVFVAELSDNSGIKRNIIPESVPQATPSLDDLMKVAYHQEEPYTYKLFRRVSIYFSWVFVRLKVNPNFITFLWLFSMWGASYLIETNINCLNRFVASLLICLHFVFDCSDGEVSRMTKTTSQAGSNLEQIAHWIVNLSIIIGASLGLYRQTGNDHMLWLGLFCLFSDSSFHYLYVQLNYWLDEKIDYGWFHKLTSAIYQVMPINLNLFLLSCVFNQLYLFLLAWSIISFSLFVLLAAGYFGKEFSVQKK